jgi:predicted nucleic acid-binding protein
MKCVLDSNVIFSCLISGKKFYIDLLSQNQCFAPDFIFEEIKKYEERILNKSGSNVNFKEFTREIFRNLVILPKLAIENENWKKAYELCKDIDENDTAFVALSLELDIPLLTRDKKLVEKLKNKHFENIMLLDKFLEYIDVE